MTSVATNAFAAARDRLAAQVTDPPEKRPAYDVFGPPIAPLPALGGLPAGGRIAAAARRSSVELVEEALARIELDQWTAFVHVDAERALAEARARDAEPRRGPLHGVPVSVKDVIHVGGMPTRCGSDAFHQVPAIDATSVDLLRDNPARPALWAVLGFSSALLVVTRNVAAVYLVMPAWVVIQKLRTPRAALCLALGALPPLAALARSARRSSTRAASTAAEPPVSAAHPRASARFTM